MVFLLSLLSFVAVAAGVFALGLGVPIRETWFGAALLIAGSVAVTGGFILVGLAAAVGQLRAVVQGFKAPLSGMPRPVRPLERRDEERIEDDARRMAPRMRMPVALDAHARDIIDAPGTRERWPKPGQEEWLLRAMAEIEPTLRHADAAPAPIDYHPDDFRRPSNSWPHSAITQPPDRTETDMRRASSNSSHHVFSKEIVETVWSPEHRNLEEGPERRAEPPAEPLAETGMRSPEPKSPPLSPAQSAASAPMRSEPVEPRPLPILKSGMIKQVPYTLFTDGSIETKMPDGAMRFASIEELLGHLEKREG
jgi:hypothetical protein